MRVEWKRAKIAFYLEQEKLIHRLDQEDPGHNPNDWEYWGYAVKPSVKYPELIGWMDYMYIVDLDSDSLTITACDDHYDSQSHGHIVYRLDNIPRWIFDLPMIDGHKEPPEGDDEDEEYGEYEEYRLSESRYETDVHPVMRSEGVADEHWDAYRPTPTPDPEMLELYSQFSPQRVPVELKDIPERDLVWRKFQLLLLTHFVEHFLGVLRAVSCFGRLGCNIPVFYQMAFAILCLAQGKNMKFQNENSLYKVLIGGNEDATPTWDPPKEDHYWLGKILIVLEPRLESEKASACRSREGYQVCQCAASRKVRCSRCHLCHRMGCPRKYQSHDPGASSSDLLTDSPVPHRRYDSISPPHETPRVPDYRGCGSA